MKFYLLYKLFFWLRLDSLVETIALEETLRSTRSYHAPSMGISGVGKSDVGVLSRSTGISKDIEGQHSSKAQDDGSKRLDSEARLLYEILKRRLLDFDNGETGSRVPSRDFTLALQINQVKSRLSGEDLLSFIHHYSSLQFDGMPETVRENILEGIEEAQAIILRCEESSNSSEAFNFHPKLNMYDSLSEAIRAIADDSTSFKTEELCMQDVIAEANKRARERKAYVLNPEQEVLFAASRKSLLDFISSNKVN